MKVLMERIKRILRSCGKVVVFPITINITKKSHCLCDFFYKKIMEN